VVTIQFYSSKQTPTSKFLCSTTKMLVLYCILLYVFTSLKINIKRGFFDVIFSIHKYTLIYMWFLIQESSLLPQGEFFFVSKFSTFCIFSIQSNLDIVRTLIECDNFRSLQQENLQNWPRYSANLDFMRNLFGSFNCTISRFDCTYMQIQFKHLFGPPTWFFV
jgi:hypothetical protein